MIELIENGLATYRLSMMLVTEQGPFGIFDKIRRASGIVYNDDGEPVAWSESNPLACLWCTSVYVSIATLILPRALVRVLAASGLVVLLDKVT
jgi:hypothetical protein